MEVELQNTISDQRIALDFETKARNSNTKRADEVRRKLAKMGRTSELPPLLDEKQLAQMVISDLEFRCSKMPYAYSFILFL